MTPPHTFATDFKSAQNEVLHPSLHVDSHHDANGTRGAFARLRADFVYGTEISSEYVTTLLNVLRLWWG